MQVLHCANADGKWSAKKMDEDEALRTVESLRGRLLAERAASKAAKEDEQLMDSKLKELEAQLRSETNAMKKFEKKLSFLRKKLESLNISYILEDSEQSGRSSSLDASESSCISSIASTEEPEQESKPQTTAKDNSESPILPQSSSLQSSVDRPTNEISFNRDSGSFSHELHANQQDPSQEMPHLDEKSANPVTDCPRSSSQIEDNDGGTCKDQEEDDVDNSMALVPLSFPAEGQEDSTGKDVMKISSESVRELLGTLKHIREEIQSTMQKRRQATRQMIQVG